MGTTADDDKIRRLLDAGRALVAELDPQAVLERILEEARQITAADEETTGILADWAATAERVVRGLEATRDVAIAIGTR